MRGTADANQGRGPPKPVFFHYIQKPLGLTLFMETPFTSC